MTLLIQSFNKFTFYALIRLHYHFQNCVNTHQVWNHTFYFSGLKQANTSKPHKQVATAIKSSFGSYTEFKDAFIKADTTLFGSGWIWLVKSTAGNLEIIQESNAGNPLRKGLKPILTCDV